MTRRKQLFDVVFPGVESLSLVFDTFDLEPCYAQVAIGHFDTATSRVIPLAIYEAEEITSVPFVTPEFPVDNLTIAFEPFQPDCVGGPEFGCDVDPQCGAGLYGGIEVNQVLVRVPGEEPEPPEPFDVAFIVDDVATVDPMPFDYTDSFEVEWPGASSVRVHFSEYDFAECDATVSLVGSEGDVIELDTSAPPVDGFSPLVPGDRVTIDVSSMGEMCEPSEPAVVRLQTRVQLRQEGFQGCNGLRAELRQAGVGPLLRNLLRGVCRFDVWATTAELGFIPDEIPVSVCDDFSDTIGVLGGSDALADSTYGDCFQVVETVCEDEVVACGGLEVDFAEARFEFEPCDTVGECPDSQFCASGSCSPCPGLVSRCGDCATYSPFEACPSPAVADPAAIRLVRPTTSRVVYEPDYTLVGVVDSAVRSVSVAGAQVSVDDNGTFASDLTLAPGANVIEVVVDAGPGRDPETISATLTYSTPADDFEPPVISVTSPGELDVVQGSPVRILGATSEPVSAVFIDGTPATVVDFEFYAEIEVVDEGETELLVEAIDLAGNVGTADIGVTVDLTNPCGGTAALAHRPGDPCGPCLWDSYECATPDTVVCNGATENLCGGCTHLSMRPGDACGPCALDSVYCVSANVAACSGATATHDAFDCGRACDSAADCVSGLCVAGVCADCDPDSTDCTSPLPVFGAPLLFHGSDATPGIELNQLLAAADGVVFGDVVSVSYEESPARIDDSRFAAGTTVSAGACPGEVRGALHVNLNVTSSTFSDSPETLTVVFAPQVLEWWRPSPYRVGGALEWHGGASTNSELGAGDTFGVVAMRIAGTDTVVPLYPLLLAEGANGIRVQEHTENLTILEPPQGLEGASIASLLSEWDLASTLPRPIPRPSDSELAMYALAVCTPEVP